MSRIWRYRVYLIPKLLILAPISAYAVLFPSLPNISGNFKRLGTIAHAKDSVDRLHVHEYASEITKRVQSGAKVFVISPHAQWISHLANVDNVFPYCENHCLVTWSQVHKLQQILTHE